MTVGARGPNEPAGSGDDPRTVDGSDASGGGRPPDDGRPGHPTVPAALLMLGIVVFLVVASYLSIR